MKLTRLLLCLVVSDTLLNGLPIIRIGAILLENVSEAQSLVPTRLIGQIHLRRILLFLILIFFIGRVIQLSAEPLEEKQERST